jgi:hypothetical protein
MNTVAHLKAKRIAPDQDIDRVARIVSEYPEIPFFLLVEKLHKILKEVTPVHYMLAGFLSGYATSAKETSKNFYRYHQN